MTVDVVLGSHQAEAPSAPQWVGWLLAAGQCLLAILLVWQWLCVSTYRLYLGARQAPQSSARSCARQRFEVRGGRVEPQGGSGLLRDRRRADAWPSQGLEDYSGQNPATSPTTRSGFDRGLFTVPVAGGVVQFAFLPPYLNSLKLSRQQLQASRGWELTRRSYREMERLVRAQGGELVVLFIPSKAQVYLPLLEASLPGAELQRALRLCLADQPQPPALEVVMRNRLALNGLMGEFCAEQGITFLDLTAELQSKLRAGHNVYFPDDSHWNAAGHETAAVALARLLRAESL